MSPAKQVTLRAVAVLAVALVAFLTVMPVGRYLLRAAWAEGRILARAVSIDALIRNPHTDAVTRAKLRFVETARSFATDSIDLRAGDSFTMYSALERDTLVLVLSAAYRDRLQPYTWWFPIVGRVPYKGFFDFGAAHGAERALERRGLDTYLRPSAAFSTLGWFNDPLLSTTLRLDSLGLANTVIHELTHNTFYAPGQAIFNESFANFVGARGSVWLFRTRGDSVNAARGEAEWADEKLLGAFWSAVYTSLDSAYAAHPESVPLRLAARDTVYARARAALLREIGPRLRTVSPRALARVRLDNAALLVRRVYRTDLELFDELYDREGHDLRRAVRRVIALARSSPRNPYGALRAWVSSPTPESAAK